LFLFEYVASADWSLAGFKPSATERKCMAYNGKKEIEQKAPKDSSKPIDKSYPVDDKAIEEQTQRLRKAAAAGAVALQPTPPPPLKSEPTATAAAQPSTPLATIAALWPSPSQKAAPTPAPQLPKARAVSSPPPLPPAPQPKAASAPQPAKARPVPSPSSAPAPKASRPQTIAVKFALTNPDAKSVSVCGEFNGWSIGASPMKRRRDGQWETVLELNPGRYQYKFVVDGEWLTDPAARESIPNPHGSLNSVIAVS
jgi:hypothetical protein